MNAILAESLDYISDAVDKASATKGTLITWLSVSTGLDSHSNVMVSAGSGVSHEDVIDGVLRDMYHKHKAIIFEGNGYSDEWKQEVRRASWANCLSVSPHCVFGCCHATGEAPWLARVCIHA